MYSNKYVTVYTVVMTLLVSVVLAVVVTGLRPVHESNEAVFKKRDVLRAIKDELGTDLASLTDAEVIDLFSNRIEQVVIDANGQPVEGVSAESVDMAKEEKKPAAERQYPVFIYRGDGATAYLLSVRGNGLWDKIWGTIAIKDDFNTIIGTSFGHVGETPGLGAEITDNPSFSRQFQGKQLFDKGQFVSVSVVKGGVRNPAHQVDAITGATITSNGVTDMLRDGLAVYLPYLASIRN
ncbi:MAG: hypothetical protein RLY31_2884 [Bacteroidota bacterium]|jgi:Na+-transporting NADH:ubiquinone oxidoreductase subunit C